MTDHYRGANDAVTQPKARQNSKKISGISRGWQAWLVTWAPLWLGRKECLAQIKIMTMGIGRGQGALVPLDFENFSTKILSS